MQKVEQHYLQKAYLRGFSPYYFEYEQKWQKEQIFILNKKTGEIKLKTATNTAIRKHYYSFYNINKELDPAIENLFSQVEDGFIKFRKKLASVIDEINFSGNVVPLEGKYRTTICEYVKLNFIRIPKIMDWIYEEAKNHEEHISTIIHEPFNKYWYKNLSIKTMLSLFEINHRDLAEYLFERDISFGFFGRTKGALVTSDNPVIRFNKNNPPGLVYIDTNILFPIDRNKFVRFFSNSGTDKYERIRDLDFITVFNDSEFINATEEIYGTSEAVLKDIYERNHRTNA